ncbi:Ldh family oxidoreductase [Glycomyces sp. NPDC048151]|uniref:Ldh family oxidoreductase n=1 Tax=Glycomyces sp. NPDC048151 TaxID=3364002 RepID=UPI00371D2BAD
MAAPIDAARLAAFGADVLAALGVPGGDARLVAESLVAADLQGHSSHGMLRLSWYAARLQSGAMAARTAPETVSDLGAVCVVDGRDGVGQVVADHACRLAVERAERHGIAAVAVRRSNHFGMAGYWTRRMAAAGCVGILTTNGSAAMAPWGGREKAIGANPWSIAVPGPEGPVVLDIANTLVARGKIYAARESGGTISADWATDAAGRPTTDPDLALAGTLLPMAGHKGYGIAFMMDVLSGVLTGSAYGTGVNGPYVPDERSGCGHLAMALRVDAVADPAEFEERLADLIAATKAVPLAPGAAEILHPGEPEARREAECRRTGITVPAKTIAGLRDLAADCGLPFPLDHPEGHR